MKIDDIRSPGMVPNSHRLRQETIKAISFCEMLKSSEKAVELIAYFREAIAYLDREVVSKDLPEFGERIVDTSAISPFDDLTDDVLPKSEDAPESLETIDEIPDHLFPVKPEFVPINKRSKKK